MLDYADPDRKIIWIPAVPSTGTSCVAGILRALGVSVGKVARPNWMLMRGYDMWEDQDFRIFGATWGPDGVKTEIVAQRHFRIRAYINYRFLQEPEGRLGFKGLSHWFHDDPEPATLPVEILDVRRPLEDAIMADFRRNQDRGIRHAGDWQGATLQPPTQEEARLRAGSLANCWLARAQLFVAHPPTHALDFYELLEDPASHVGEIVEAFGLESTEEQIATAIATVDARMRTV